MCARAPPYDGTTKLLSSQPEFLERMEALAPDLCVTAAYGNMLPQRFLDIPKHGTPPSSMVAARLSTSPDCPSGQSPRLRMGADKKAHLTQECAWSPTQAL
jgi:hypothetical protein